MPKSIETYYLINGEEVTFEEWIRIEQEQCGFIPWKRGKIATSGFSAIGKDGAHYRGSIGHRRVSAKAKAVRGENVQQDTNTEEPEGSEAA